MRLRDRARLELGHLLVAAGTWLIGETPLARAVRQERRDFEHEDELRQQNEPPVKLQLTPTVGLTPRAREMIEQGRAPEAREEEPAEAPLKGSLRAQRRAS